MSRTYRKNTRYYRKHRGLIYNTYGDRTLKGEARSFEFVDWNPKKSFTERPIHWDGACCRCEVLVGDSENYHRSPDKNWKAKSHRIDRARFNQALLKNEDAHISTACDPWIWD